MQSRPTVESITPPGGSVGLDEIALATLETRPVESELLDVEAEPVNEIASVSALSKASVLAAVILGPMLAAGLVNVEPAIPRPAIVDAATVLPLQYHTGHVAHPSSFASRTLWIPEWLRLNGAAPLTMLRSWTSQPLCGWIRWNGRPLSGWLEWGVITGVAGLATTLAIEIPQLVKSYSLPGACA